MYNSANHVKRALTASEIRKTFIEYFVKSHDHKFIRSSPVVPFCDPTVAFVNAGMNQFKSIFLGKTQPVHKRVVNYQKCVRVGGKHNDLSLIGLDGYHHTFFEMLGNWSFGDYSKHDACQMALNLLCGPYGIDQSLLYVTYFGGDKELGLPADMECQDIWRSLGFSNERLLPFGSQDNFWEMGPTGPCGPCTEIHIDHSPELGSITDRAKRVNAGRPDLTELWNLVFIQFNRQDDGSLSLLPLQHVDTGMGFERLTALLQGHASNYNTDLFMPIFTGIQQISGAPAYSNSFPTYKVKYNLDTSYRILADHARMITVCIADGMLPDQNQKLRRIVRKALNVSEVIFAKENLLRELVPIVVNTLSEAYPELAVRQNSVIELIRHEQEVYRDVRDKSTKAFAKVLTEFPNLNDLELMECPGFVPAFRDFQQQKSTFENNVIPGSFLFKLSDTYGITEENFAKFSEVMNMTYDIKGYRKEIELAKLRSRRGMGEGDLTQELRILSAQLDLTNRLPATDNSFKYEYTYNSDDSTYILPKLSCNVLGILHNDAEVSRIIGSRIHESVDKISIVTEKSNFYYTSGGQKADIGSILFKTKQGVEHNLDVVDVKIVNDCVVHICLVRNSPDDLELAIGDKVKLIVDESSRTQNIQHHTAVHLLNAAIRNLFKKTIYQVSSSVSPEQCRLDVAIIGVKLCKEDIKRIENFIGYIIDQAVPVKTTLLSSSDIFQQDDIITVPGELYPEYGIRLVSICPDNSDFISKEPCCGTHARNTKELEQFCFINVKQTNRTRYSFTAVAGSAGFKILKTKQLLEYRLDMIEKHFEAGTLDKIMEDELRTIRHNMQHSGIQLPFGCKIDSLERINTMLDKQKKVNCVALSKVLEKEIQQMLKNNDSNANLFILHCFNVSHAAIIEGISLENATGLCVDRPILVISKCGDILKARCCVPKQFVTEEFDAGKWLSTFFKVLNFPVKIQGDKTSFVCHIKPKKLPKDVERKFELAMRTADQYARRHIQPATTSTIV